MLPVVTHVPGVPIGSLQILQTKASRPPANVLWMGLPAVPGKPDPVVEVKPVT
jgi:hypothetical protein